MRDLRSGLRRAWVAAGAGLVAAAVLAVSAAVAAAPTVPQIYWANENGNTVGRANLDGTGVNQGFITGATDPVAVAVDGQHIYWANNNGNGTIGRANLDGTDANQSFITTAASPFGLAVDDQHVYWANDGIPGTIGRANLDGTDVDQSFITGADIPEGVAVADQQIYWANAGNGTIGQANLDGTDVNQSFITGAFSPDGVAVDDQHIYWANEVDGTIGQANLDGTDVNQSFITGANAPVGVAVSVPFAQISPASLPAFAATMPGAFSAPQTLTITNGGQQDLSISNVSVVGQDPNDFLVRSNACMAAALSPGGSCQLVVQFAPLVVGSRTATLQIATNDFANNPLQVLLAGTGQTPTPPPTTTTTPATTTPVIAPALRSLKVSPKTFETTGRKTKGKCLAQTKQNKKSPACTRNARLTISYTLSAAATVKFKITGKLPGRKAGNKCVAQTKHNSHAKKCTHSITLTILAAEKGKAGANHFTLSRKLAPGTYTLTATPAGGAAKRATYQIVA